MREMPRVDAYIGVGSNVEPEAHIVRALDILDRHVRIVAVSSFYRTEPIGPPGQPPFVNGVIRIITSILPRALKFDILRAVEAELGRVRPVANRYLPRPIDLDLLLYGGLVVREADLTLPDPDLRTRPFLVRAVLELEPALVLPDTGLPLRSVSVEDTSRPVDLPELTADLKARFSGHAAGFTRASGPGPRCRR